MDPNMENYFRMQQSGGYKIPFYMAYPMQDVYLSEIEYERDRERLKEMYPKEAKRIQRVVEEECDKMEYDGSLMFDEYPDRVMVQKLCDDIYNKVYDNTTAEVETEQYKDRRPGGGFPPPPPPPVLPPLLQATSNIPHVRQRASIAATIRKIFFFIRYSLIIFGNAHRLPNVHFPTLMFLING